MTTEPLDIRLEGVGKVFGETLRALDDVSLEMKPGSFTAVVGASGSGKSTLLRLIGDLDESSEGAITIGGATPATIRASKQIGWMSQRPALLPWRTALENVALAQTINPRRERSSSARPEDLLEMVGLADFAHAHPHELSGGMQQRVSLARTLAIGAPVWLMDEPFAALDELTRETLAEDLLEIWDAVRPTVVWVTHHLPEAVKLADQVALLTPSPGRLAEVIEVGLSRPRDETDTTFQAVVRRARLVLRRVGERPLETAL